MATQNVTSYRREGRIGVGAHAAAVWLPPGGSALESRMGANIRSRPELLDVINPTPATGVGLALDHGGQEFSFREFVPETTGVVAVR